MSAKDNGEGFLARWSRLKRGDEPLTALAQDATDPVPAPADAQLPATDLPSLADLTKLPRLEDLTASSDFAAFLQKGVPEQLQRLALRKAWSTDPAIRDFVEVAENQYDWNAVGGVPGFGEIAAGTDMKALLAQAIGEIPKTVVETVAEKDGALAVHEAPAPPPQALPELCAVRQEAPIPALTLQSAASEPDAAEPPRPAQRPRHGGALPQLPTAGRQ